MNVLKYHYHQLLVLIQIDGVSDLTENASFEFLYMYVYLYETFISKLIWIEKKKRWEEIICICFDWNLMKKSRYLNDPVTCWKIFCMIHSSNTNNSKRLSETFILNLIENKNIKWTYLLKFLSSKSMSLICMYRKIKCLLHFITPYSNCIDYVETNMLYVWFVFDWSHMYCIQIPDSCDIIRFSIQTPHPKILKASCNEKNYTDLNHGRINFKQ